VSEKGYLFLVESENILHAHFLHSFFKAHSFSLSLALHGDFNASHAVEKKNGKHEFFFHISSGVSSRAWQSSHSGVGSEKVISS